jgi:hypothetical protein
MYSKQSGKITSEQKEKKSGQIEEKRRNSSDVKKTK